MTKNNGSILPITLILTAALFLLTGLMYMVNRQYQAEIEVMDEEVERRQLLLSIAKKVLQGIAGQDSKEFIEWQSCDLSEVPSLSWHEGYDVYHQQAILDDSCGFGYQAYRVWLSSDESHELLLVIDALLLDQKEWGEEIFDHEESIALVFEDGIWTIQIETQYESQRVSIFEDEDERALKYRKIRRSQGAYELVLLFDNKHTHALELYRFIVSAETLRVSEVETLRLNVESMGRHQEIVGRDFNGRQMKNWKLLLSEIHLKDVVLHNEVLFLAFEQDKTEGLIGLYLNGQGFWGEGKYGVQQLLDQGALDEYVLVECHQENPLWIGGVWQVGCFNQSIFRYFYSER